MYHRVFRNESYCLGISVLIIFMLYYIIICNSRVTLNQKYTDYKISTERSPEVSIKPEHFQDSIDTKNEMANSIFNAFNSVVHMKPFLQHIIVHIDLKGAPPKVLYLKEFMRLIKSFGATGILVEYEDMFPYSGELEELSALNAYSQAQVTELYQTAKDIGLEFIPLLQTFGHLEFMLKLKRFANLREVPIYPQVICPTHNDTISTLNMMIDQVVQLHPGIKWLHIGSDEVYFLGECERCQRVIKTNNWSKDDLFLSHATQLVKYVKNKFQITPIMWDDEFRKIPLSILKESVITKIVEIMVWQYSPGIIEKIPTNVWDKYTEFRGVWIASAFKGAAEPNSFITDVGKRINNNKEWMDVYHMLQSSIPFMGITLTGWQRFDHFAVLCELLPEAIPSLALNIAYIKTNKLDHATISNVGDKLGCDSYLNTDLQYLEYVNDCRYPGSDILKAIQKLYILKKDVKSMVSSDYFKGWISPYNIKHKFASPHYVEIGLQNVSSLQFECQKLLTELKNAMSHVYDDYTVNEWLTTYVYPLQQELNDLHDKKISLLAQNTWKRNPQD